MTWRIDVASLQVKSRVDGSQTATEVLVMCVPYVLEDTRGSIVGKVCANHFMGRKVEHMILGHFVVDGHETDRTAAAKDPGGQAGMNHGHVCQMRTTRVRAGRTGSYHGSISPVWTEKRSEIHDTPRKLIGYEFG